VQLSWNTLNEHERDFGEAFFLLDVQAFRANYEEFLGAFRAIYPRSQIAYSYKTNYIPRLCWEVDRLGGYAEVVSAMEYQLAVRVGVNPERIIFNGPCKSEDDLERALLAGSLVNLDADYEVALIEAIARRHPRATLTVGLRCNFVLEDTPSSRFGFDVEDDGLCPVLERLRGIDNCVVAGLHCHFSTGQRSVESYAQRTRRLLELSASCFPHHPPRFVNVGGGYFSKMSPELRSQFPSPVPSYQEYAAAVASEVAAAYPGADGPELVLEPGAALTSDVMSFVAKVVARKRVRTREIALVAGSIHNIKPTLHGKQLPMRVVRPAADAPGEVPGQLPVDVVGYTCMEHDCLYRGYPQAVRPGDFVVFENVGAYTVVMKPPFIRPAPAILVCDRDGSFEVARRAECFDDLFGAFSFPAQSERAPIRMQPRAVRS
jgi:diaminopimelate decarboxylase